VITEHRLDSGAAADLRSVSDASVHCVVTSPPYPMIEMWDEDFSTADAQVRGLLEQGDGARSWEAMHAQLDRVWQAVARTLVPGGVACINIGDATRNLANDFQLYVNHARVLQAFLRLGFTALPCVLWRKPTNAPTKFMGSGMLPPGAHVTLEHEYVLILRKAGKRQLTRDADRERRRRSAFFWEERNQWFSDVWMDLMGQRQELLDVQTRRRSGAFPLELPFRLISMFSLQEDTVLDPFAGTGTTALAALAAGRNSVGMEQAEDLVQVSRERFAAGVQLAAERTRRRLRDHADFLAQRQAAGKPPKHHNAPHDTPVMSKQESDLALVLPQHLEHLGDGRFGATHGIATAEDPDEKLSLDL